MPAPQGRFMLYDTTSRARLSEVEADDMTCVVLRWLEGQPSTSIARCGGIVTLRPSRDPTSGEGGCFGLTDEVTVECALGHSVQTIGSALDDIDVSRQRLSAKMAFRLPYLPTKTS